MFAKIIIVACVVAVVNAGNLGAPVGYAAEPANYAAPAYESYSAPAAQTAYAAAPGAQAAYTQAAYDAQGNQAAYSQAASAAPVAQAAYTQAAYDAQGNQAAYSQAAYAAPVAQAAPVAHTTYAAAPVTHNTYESAPVAQAGPADVHGARLLGVAYSSAAAVSHVNYKSPLIGYGW